jgi:hypothetical protein
LFVCLFVEPDWLSDRTNAALDKTGRIVAELLPGTIVLMKNEDRGNDEAPTTTIGGDQGASSLPRSSFFMSTIVPGRSSATIRPVLSSAALVRSAQLNLNSPLEGRQSGSTNKQTNKQTLKTN